ncbi:MAG: sensor histidine kinase [Limisphaerales bacterium]
MSRNTSNVIGADSREAHELASQLAAIVQSSDDAIVSKNLDGIVVNWNAAAERIFGYSASEMIGQPIAKLIPEDRLDEESNILAQIRAGRRVDHYETVRKRKDGTLIEVSLTVSPVTNSEGIIVGASKIARDITERKRVEERQKLLMGEMKHRVNNLEAVIQSLGRSAIPKNEPAVEAFFDAFMGRLHALLSVGDLVVSSTSRQADLRDVINRALEPFLNAGTGSAIKLAGPSLHLAENTSGGLALAMHELATNAIKYGALKADGGTVELHWSVEPDGENGRRVKIEWKERVDSVISEPENRGFGSRLIRAAIAAERDHRTDVVFEPDGLRCTFQFHIAGEVGSRPC